MEVYHPIDTTYALEIIAAQLFEAYCIQKFGLPAFDAAVHPDGHVTLFANGAAEAS